MLTVYCWLLIHTQSVGTGNRVGNSDGPFGVQLEIARDCSSHLDTLGESSMIVLEAHDN